MIRLSDVDLNHGAFAVRVDCNLCGLRVQLAEARADLNGRPFVDYYCLPCCDAIATQRAARLSQCPAWQRVGRPEGE